MRHISLCSIAIPYPSCSSACEPSEVHPSIHTHRFRVTWRQTVFLAFACAIAPAQAEEIKIATFNTESGGNTQSVLVAETITSVDGVDIWGLQEVESENALVRYRDAARNSGGGNWRYVRSESGYSSDPDFKPDYLGILYRTDIFRQIETVELHSIRSEPGSDYYGSANWGLRGALFLRLLHYRSNTEFYVGNVHLKCCGEGIPVRQHQAKLIANWITTAEVPVILIGDTNIPIRPGLTAAQVDSLAFREFTRDDVLTWVEPDNPYKTQCNPNYNSMLDQIYHSPGFLMDSAKTEIQFTTPDYCENDSHGYADHRPIVGTFQFP